MKVVKWLDEHLEEFLMGVLLILMALIMGVQVACRYCLNYSLSWSEELTRYLFIWAGFISISFCVKKKISIKIEQFEMMLSEQTKKILDICRYTLILCFAVYMIPFSVAYLNQCIHNGSTSAAMGVPLYVIQVAPLVGFILLIIRIIQAWILAFQKLTEKGEKQA